jgi:DNA modification methylase
LAVVPTIKLRHLNDAQKRALVIADNRLAELATWDGQMLAEELEFLTSADISFDAEITGFRTEEIDIAIAGHNHLPADPKLDAIPTLDLNRVVTLPGDLWLLGRHRVLCADAREEAAYKLVLNGASAHAIFTDPPYNVKIAGGVSGLGKVKHRDFAMAVGEMSERQFVEFLENVLLLCARFSVDGSIHFVCMDWRHAGELLAAGKRVYSRLMNLCVWNKKNAGMGAFYRSKHELVFVFKSGNKAHRNNFGLGATGRYRTNVWDYAGLNSFKAGREDQLSMHPTVKPVALVADAIKDCTKRNQIILDPFGGSGTTIIAAELTGRTGCVIEIDPGYVDVIARRFQEFAGIDARHAVSGESFAECEEKRLAAKKAEPRRPAATARKRPSAQ